MKLVKNTYLIITALLSLMLLSCTPKPENVSEASSQLDIYPDYKDITIPENIAPLNFMLRNDGVEAIEVVIKGKRDNMTLNLKGYKAIFPIDKWKKFIFSQKEGNLKISVTARIYGKWYHFMDFTWKLVSEKIDSYVSYRLIEPGYEVWSDLEICERCLENFDERILANNSQIENSCMNCHIHGNAKGNLSMFHLRGKKGGTILNRNGKLRKLSLKSDSMISAAVYGDFHPQGRFAVFSSNIIVPAFHSKGSLRMEVYDNGSDLSIADLDKNRIITSPLTSRKDMLETFPTFSADGKLIYFCTAPFITNMDSLKNLHYSLCSISFDANKGKWGERIDTIWNARLNKGSVCQPKASPDGKYLMFTIADYGTFPIWHRETDLKLLDLQSGKIDDMKIVNSNRSDTYHSWSSSGKWFAFASKRGDGQYGRIYIAHIDKNGKIGKAFVIPQSDPEADDMNLKSYNIPDLSKDKVPFNKDDVKRIYYNTEAEKFI